MSDSRRDLPINKGLLDAWSVGRTLVDLKERFYPVEFFDLCSIIEEITLRDEIVLVGKYEMLPRDYRAALHPFVANGVFRTVIVSTTILKTDVVDDTLRSSSLRARSQGLTNATLKDADYSVTRLLGAEIDLRVPTIALLQHLHNYHFVRRPALDNAICDLAGRYRDLKQRAEAAKALDYGRLGLKQIGVPPIALQVMQRARTYEQLAQEILQVRHEYRVTRQTMRNLTEC